MTAAYTKLSLRNYSKLDKNDVALSVTRLNGDKKQELDLYSNPFQPLEIIKEMGICSISFLKSYHDCSAFTFIF